MSEGRGECSSRCDARNGLARIIEDGMMPREFSETDSTLGHYAKMGSSRRCDWSVFKMLPVWDRSHFVLLWYLRFDEFSQKDERFLPAKIASLSGYHGGHALLHDVQVCPAENRLQSDRHVHHSRQVRIIKPVRVADAFVRNQFKIVATERMTLAIGEVGEIGRASCRERVCT